MIGLGAALLGAAAIQGGSSLAGGLIARKGQGHVKPRLLNIMTPRQKQIEAALYDFLMGNKRNANGDIVSQDPWVRKLLNKRLFRTLAPLTMEQRRIIGAAGGMLDRIANPARPDARYLADLRAGISPHRMQGSSSVLYAALGATQVPPGQKVVVGEDGPEIVEAMPGGGMNVWPNPKSVSSEKNIASARAKSRRAERQYNLPGAALPRRMFEYDNPAEPGRKARAWLPVDTGDWKGNYWDMNQPYTRPLKSSFENWLQDKYAGEDWYQDFQKRFGGDIGKVAYAGKGPASKIRTGRQGKIHQGYGAALNEYLATLPEVWNNPDLEKVMAGVPQEALGGFGDYLKQNPQYGLHENYVLQQGKWSFQDPYSVDIGNLNRALGEYMQGQGYTQGEDGTWTKQQQEQKQQSPQWSILTSRIGPEKKDQFNRFLNSYEGGIMAGQGIQFDPTTGQYRFNAPEANFPGMMKAVGAFLAQEQDASANTTEATQTATQAEDDTIVGTNRQLNDMLSALSVYTDQFDPQQANRNFEAAVYQPAMKDLQENTLPLIDQSYAGGNLFSSARNKARQKATTDLAAALEANRANYLQAAEEAHKNRALAAADAMQRLYRLPQESLTAQARREHIQALTNSVFNNMAWTDALQSANLDNQTLTNLALLWQLFEPQRQYDQQQLDAAMLNAFNADGGLSLEKIIPWMTGQENIQNYIAY